MAVLLRSVKSNAEPITTALQAAGIPFVVTGMTNLFGTAEAGAARQLFYLIGDHHGVDEAAVESAWNGANLGLDRAALQSAIQGAAAAKSALTDPDQKRWGQYSIQRVFLNFLEQAGIREERVPDGRGEVVFYNLGKFSQLISDFETIHYQSKPVEKYASFALFDRKRRATEYKAAGSGYVSAWYLDEDYDGDCFVDCQMFFDFKKTPNIKTALKADVDPDEFTLKLASEPFPVRGYKRIAAKVVKVYGNESTIVRDLPT